MKFLDYISTVILHFGILSLSVDAQEEFPTVATEKGNLKGTFLKSRGGNSYSAFLGIPYANPPQRFKLAKSVTAWAGIRNAVKFGAKCAQVKSSSPTKNVTGSEDCLFLNIYSPQLNGNLPVMLYIHGGSYVSGSSNGHQASYFMDEKIVLVTINYRLGALGFLDTGDGVFEPNLGLKDQVLALKFVQSNIKAFGGDPSRVTIFGESAGASAVHHHLLSPLSQGLFSQAIAQSGSALGWGITPHPEKFAFKLGTLLGCFSQGAVDKKSKVLLRCLENQSLENILTQNVLGEISVGALLLSFLPSVEIPGKSEQIFMDDTPINVLKSGNFSSVPTIFTANADEGIIASVVAFNANNKNQLDLNNDFLRLFPHILMYNDFGLFPYERNWMSTQIKDFYFGTSQIDNTTFKNITDMFSDRYFFHPIENSIELHSKYSSENSKVYNGLFTYQGKNSLASLLGFKGFKSIGHADELQYFFDGLPLNAEDESASKEFVRLWASFATNENNLVHNGVRWNEVNYSTLQKEGMVWFTLDAKPKTLQDPFNERMDFWEKLISQARPQDQNELGNIIK